VLEYICVVYRQLMENPNDKEAAAAVAKTMDPRVLKQMGGVSGMVQRLQV
jgi:hypothetical protein